MNLKQALPDAMLFTLKFQSKAAHIRLHPEIIERCNHYIEKSVLLSYAKLENYCIKNQEDILSVLKTPHYQRIKDLILKAKYEKSTHSNQCSNDTKRVYAKKATIKSRTNE